MVIIMLGAPGTGKGTVSGMLSNKLNIPQVSTGDIFRKHIKEQTELGKLAESYISKGKLVPDDVTVELVKNRLQDEDVQDGIILDGFPRTIKQAEALDEMLKNMDRKVSMTVNLTTPEDELVERVVNRRICPKCKAVYNLVLNPPEKENICNNCGHELVTRKDDNEETFKGRLNTYFEETKPLVNYYDKQNKLFSAVVSKSINKMGKDVTKDVLDYIKKNHID